MKTLNPILIVLLLLFSFGHADAQKIEGMEGEMSGSGGSDNGGGGDIDGEGWLFLVDFFFNVGFYPTYGLLFGFEREIPANDFNFNEYPYADERNGLYLPLDRAGRSGRAQVNFHLQNNEDAVYGGFLQVKYYPDRFVIIDVNRLQLFEDLEDEATDRLAFNNFNIQFNRIRSPRFNLFWGAGLMLVEGSDTNAGFSLSGGFTWFFKKPLSLHAESQIGWPGGAFARQNQARVQVHLNRFMIYAGYQGTKVGSVGVPNWAMGTGVWF